MTDDLHFLCVREAPLCTALDNTSFFTYPRISKNIAPLAFHKFSLWSAVPWATAFISVRAKRLLTQHPAITRFVSYPCISKNIAPRAAKNFLCVGCSLGDRLLSLCARSASLHSSRQHIIFHLSPHLKKYCPRLLFTNFLCGRLFPG